MSCIFLYFYTTLFPRNRRKKIHHQARNFFVQNHLGPAVTQLHHSLMDSICNKSLISVHHPNRCMGTKERTIPVLTKDRSIMQVSKNHVNSYHCFQLFCDLLRFLSINAVSKMHIILFLLLPFLKLIFNEHITLFRSR